MKQYLELLDNILKNGDEKGDRTGTGTKNLFGTMNTYDLSVGFPLLTTKKMFWKGVVYELLWFLRGETNIKFLVDNGVHIWDEWADEHGELGPVYGKQWRKWRCSDGTHKDQISDVISQIKNNPNSRRLIVSAWNVEDVDKMKLPPCHCFFQFDVTNGKLSCCLYQRSADTFLGVPFNIASYALLTHMVAQVTGLSVGHFTHMIGSAHIYKNHYAQVQEQLARTPRTLPTLKIVRPVSDIFDFRYDDFVLENYDPYPAIKADISV